MDPMFVKDRLALMLDHFSVVGDPREGCKVRYPLREVLFLVTCATIAGCDDYDEIADWGPSQGVAHLGFLQGYSEYYFGTPKEDWLRVVLNRIEPALFEACFTDWALTLRQGAPDLIALDGKSLRRSGDAGHKPLHLVSAWASTQRLVLAQEAVDSTENECAAMLAILNRLTITGALVTIDAIATNPVMAGAILGRGGDYLLALKRNQPTLHGEVAAYFDDPATRGLTAHVDVDKDHGRIETRTTTVSHDAGWLTGDRRHPGEHRFAGLTSLVRAVTTVERGGKISSETRYFISSPPLTPDRAAQAVRSHWGTLSLHWVLDIIFRADLSRLRRGHGAANMALIRRLAFNMVRQGKGQRSIKTARKAAGWNTQTLVDILNTPPR